MQAEELSERALEFDIPFYDLSFQGTPFRSNVVLQPTTYCLINLTDIVCIALVEIDAHGLPAAVCADAVGD